MSRHKLEGGDHAELLALVGRVRERAARALGAVPAVVSCYEAGYDGFWLHRLLLAAGITNYVFDPASIAGRRDLFWHAAAIFLRDRNQGAAI